MSTTTLPTPHNTVLYTGDVRQCSNIASLGVSNHCPTAALTALECTIGCWVKHGEHSTVSEPLRIDHPNLMFVINPEEREKLNIVCKVFLHANCPPQAVDDAFAKVLAEHKIDKFDVALLDLPRHDGQLPTNVQDYWQHVEALQQKGCAAQIGVSDFTATELASLLDTAKTAPQELQLLSDGHIATVADAAKFAESKGLNVGTHGDAAGYTTCIERGLPSLFEKLPLEKSPSALHLQWIARVSVIDKTRSVLVDLGYVTSVSLAATA